MPLIIEQQPSPLIPHELKPTEWIIRKTDIFTVEGDAARIVIGFNTGSGTPGQNITLNGQMFMTDNSTPYTAETWDYAATPQGAANNFMNMIRSSYAFAEWSVSLDVIAGTYYVNIENGEDGVLTPFENNTGTLTPSVITSFLNGVDQVKSTDRFWYQFWEGNTPVSEQKFAAFDDSGRVRVDAEPQARKLLGVIDPYLFWANPRRDERMVSEVYLRFGTYSQGVNCDTSFNQSYETPVITLVNALYQHEILSQFKPFTPNYTLPVRWMTARDNDRRICKESYEFTSIFLQASALFPDGAFRINYVYYSADDQVVDTKTVSVISREPSVYHVSTGPANLIHNTGTIALSSYYTIQVEVRGNDSNYTPYSDLMTLRLGSCNCWAAEVYYLEDAGSWGTVVFESLEERRIEMSAVEWNGPIQYNEYGSTKDGIRLYQDGGKESFASDVDSVFVLMTERITERNRKAYEEFLRSSRHVILTKSDLLPLATRRIIIERGAYGVYRRGESKRLLIPFRFNTYQRTR